MKYKTTIESCESVGLTADKFLNEKHGKLFTEAKAKWEGAKGSIDMAALDKYIADNMDPETKALQAEIEKAKKEGNMGDAEALKRKMSRKMSKAACADGSEEDCSTALKKYGR